MKLGVEAKSAAVGLAVTGGLLAYSVSSFAGLLSPVVPLALCPPTILFTAFIDTQPSNGELVVAWLLVGSLNATLYGVVGTFLSLVWKSK